MTKKYQKPTSRSLGDLETAEGSCGTGYTVRNPCVVGSNYNICTVGSYFDNGNPCLAYGTSAASCNPVGITANLP